MTSLRRFNLQSSVLAAALALVFTPVFAPGASDTKEKSEHQNHQDYAELAKVPQKARARPNPLASDPEAVASGRKLFAQHCAECHGSAAEGGKKALSLRADEIQQATPGTLFWILTNGVVRRGMPVWSKLPEAQRWQIVTFLKYLPPTGTAEPADSKTKSPINH
jgi:mono/diheme cytochrome c family protein